MKATKIFLAICVVFMVYTLFAQDNNDEGKRVEYLLKDRVDFRAVDKYYNFIPGVVYYADEGFRVFSGYDTSKCGTDQEYVILRYQNWSHRAKKNGDTTPYQPHSKVVKLAEVNAKIYAIDSTIRTIESMYQDSVEVKGIRKPDAIKNLRQKKENLLIEKAALEQSTSAVEHLPILGKDDVILALPKSVFERLLADKKLVDVYSLKGRYRWSLASGFMTIPFKFRPKTDEANFCMTTDVTLGAYLGAKMRLTRTGHYFLVWPATLGLSYINLNDNTTSSDAPEDMTGIVPGITWSLGAVFDLNKFNVGCVVGQDFASGVGSNWIYNKKFWFSFAIGYSFLK